MHDSFDDDENVRAMRETAESIGLTDLLVRATQTADGSLSMELIRQALTMLGAGDRAGAL